MFILYAVVIGLVVGVLGRGRLDGLAELRFRFGGVIVAGLLIQVALFSSQMNAWIGNAGPPIYVLSTTAVILAVLANRSIRAMPIVALGAACNLAAIVANGGYMPAADSALKALDKVPLTVYSNSVVVPDAALAALTDIFALPSWLPWANVFSIGDVIIAVGVAAVIVSAMRRHAPDPVVEGPVAAS
jgi:Family of unknown function (DUF5317)